MLYMYVFTRLNNLPDTFLTFEQAYILMRDCYTQDGHTLGVSCNCSKFWLTECLLLLLNLNQPHGIPIC